MAKRNIYDDANPFAPEIREIKSRKKAAHGETPVQRLGLLFNAGNKPAYNGMFRMKMRMQSMDAYSRHKQLINNYVLFYAGSTSKLQRDTSKDKNDFDIIRVIDCLKGGRGEGYCT